MSTETSTLRFSKAYVSDDKIKHNQVRNTSLSFINQLVESEFSLMKFLNIHIVVHHIISHASAKQTWSQHLDAQKEEISIPASMEGEIELISVSPRFSSQGLHSLPEPLRCQATVVAVQHMQPLHLH